MSHHFTYQIHIPKNKHYKVSIQNFPLSTQQSPSQIIKTSKKNLSLTFPSNPFQTLLQKPKKTCKTLSITLTLQQKPCHQPPLLHNNKNNGKHSNNPSTLTRIRHPRLLREQNSPLPKQIRNNLAKVSIIPVNIRKTQSCDAGPYQIQSKYSKTSRGLLEKS